MKIALVTPCDFAYSSGVNIHASSQERRFKVGLFQKSDGQWQS